jgi:hypothetical protein
VPSGAWGFKSLLPHQNRSAGQGPLRGLSPFPGSDTRAVLDGGPGTPHTVDVDELGIHSGSLGAGKTFTTRPIDKAGTFILYCKQHDQRGHKTSLIVSPAWTSPTPVPTTPTTAPTTTSTTKTTATTKPLATTTTANSSAGSSPTTTARPTTTATGAPGTGHDRPVHDVVQQRKRDEVRAQREPGPIPP